MLAIRKDGKEEFRRAVRAWPRLSHSLSVIRTEKQYDKAVEFLDFLLATVGGDENHPLADLLDLVGTLVEDYDNKHFKEPAPDPRGMLEFFMEQHGLTQKDLPELGSQGVVSEILNGKRKLNLRQIKALGKRFHVPPAVFIGDEIPEPKEESIRRKIERLGIGKQDVAQAVRWARKKNR